MTEEPKELSDLEKEILEANLIYQERLDRLREAEIALRGAVDDYQKRRVVLQQQIWQNRGMAHCAHCGKALPIENTWLVYVEEALPQSEFSCCDKKRCEVLRLCLVHAKAELKKPNSIKTGFQSHKVEQGTDGEFYLKTSWGLLSIDDTMPVAIKVNRVPTGREFEFGKDIQLRSPSNELFINGTRINNSH